MPRHDARAADEMRRVEVRTGVQKDPAGSVQIACGRTVVLCAASVEEQVPSWMRREGRKQGWVTAEYAMLPGATQQRSSRRGGGRAREIQRLVGRSLRAAVDLEALGERTITVDCDVIQADGGTRTASVTGGFIAVALAVRRLRADGLLEDDPIRLPVSAVSCGIVGGETVLDLDYVEDSSAEVDMNFVLAADGRFVEVQGTAEGEPFDRARLDQMIDLARKGAEELFAIQRRVIEADG